MTDEEFEAIKKECKAIDEYTECDCLICDQHEIAYHSARDAPEEDWLKNMVAGGLSVEDSKRWIGIFNDIGI